MAKHIGIVACSAEGAALCYRTICSESPDLMGEYMHPEISMHNHPLGVYMKYIYEKEWKGVAELMISSESKIAQNGADFSICPDNTIHEAMEYVRKKAKLTWLHIAEVVADKAKENGFGKLAILGTKYLMSGPVYPDTLERYGIGFDIPDEDERENINKIIFKELVNGIFTERARLYLNEVIARLKKKGCEAAVLGCTEIPLIVDPADCPLPVLDSTRLLARAAIKYSLE